MPSGASFFTGNNAAAAKPGSFVAPRMMSTGGSGYTGYGSSTLDINPKVTLQFLGSSCRSNTYLFFACPVQSGAIKAEEVHDEREAWASSIADRFICFTCLLSCELL